MAEAVTERDDVIDSSEDVPHSRKRMLRRVVASGLVIKPQQRGEPDLTEEEKITILSSLLQTKPGVFLMRYGSVLDRTDLDLFSDSSDYEVQFRVRQLMKDLVPENRRRRTSNRRYQCMKELMDKSDYFSIEEMRQRDPLLFQRYVGRYMSEEEMAELEGGRTRDMTLSSHILQWMRLDERRKRERRQREEEEELEEEEEEEDESSTEEEEEEEMDEVKTDTTEEKRREMKREFLEAMQQSFLRGEDIDFDYSKVDQNDSYDNIEAQQQDGEDVYFDSEEPNWISNNDRRNPTTSEEKNN